MMSINFTDDLARVERLIRDAKEWSCVCAIFSFLGLISMFWALSMQEQFGEGSWNAITFSLGLLQTMLAVIAFGGFWLVRGVAKDAAKAEAKAICDKLAVEAVKQVKTDTQDLINGELTTILNSPIGNQMIRDIIRQLELAKSMTPEQIASKESKDIGLVIKNDPTHAGYDWAEERGTFIVPNTNLEENDG